MPLTTLLPTALPLPRRLSGLLARRRAVVMSDAVIETHLDLPIRHHTAEEVGALAVFDMGRDMARQSAWDELSALIARHDLAGDLTDAGTPLAELLSAGARADLIAALADAAHRNRLSAQTPALLAIDDLRDELTDTGMGHGGAVMAAEMLMAAGWAHYDQGVHRGAPTRFLAEFQTFFAHARAAIDGLVTDPPSPALAACHCGLLAGRHDAADHVVSAYEALIAANPLAPGPLRAFGLHLLPHWFGSHATLEVQARRAAVATQTVWGVGGYAWVWLDALVLDPTGFAYLDVAMFVDGVEDILRRRPDQHHVNLMGAYLSRYLDQEAQGGLDRSQRQVLERCRAGLLRGHLTELHPWVWALSPQSDPGTAPVLRQPSARLLEEGQKLSHTAMAAVFQEELRGLRLG